MNIWLIISLLLALGLVVGNILLLKMSAKMKFEKSEIETETKPDDEMLKTDSSNSSQTNKTV